MPTQRKRRPMLSYARGGRVNANAMADRLRLIFSPVGSGRWPLAWPWNEKAKAGGGQGRVISCRCRRITRQRIGQEYNRSINLRWTSDLQIRIAENGARVSALIVHYYNYNHKHSIVRISLARTQNLKSQPYYSRILPVRNCETRFPLSVPNYGNFKYLRYFYKSHHYHNYSLIMKIILFSPKMKTPPPFDQNKCSNGGISQIAVETSR